MARWEQNNVLLRNFQQSNTLMEATCLANGYVLWKDTCWNKISLKVIEYYIRNSNYSQKNTELQVFVYSKCQLLRVFHQIWNHPFANRVSVTGKHLRWELDTKYSSGNNLGSVSDRRTEAPIHQSEDKKLCSHSLYVSNELCEAKCFFNGSGQAGSKY